MEETILRRINHPDYGNSKGSRFFQAEHGILPPTCQPEFTSEEPIDNFDNPAELMKLVVRDSD